MGTLATAAPEIMYQSHLAVPQEALPSLWTDQFTATIDQYASSQPSSQRRYTSMEGSVLEGATHPDRQAPLSTDVLQDYAPILLHYWSNVLLPERFPFDIRCMDLELTRHSSTIRAEIQDAIAEPSRLYSLLGMIAVQMLARNNTLNIAGFTLYDDICLALLYKTKAQESAQSALDQGSLDMGLAKDLQRLSTIALQSDLNGAAKLHFRSMMEVVEVNGGLPAFDSYFIETEILLHWYGALRTLEKPAISLWSAVVEPAAVLQLRSWQTRLEGDDSGSELHSLLHAGQIAPAIRSILDELALILRFVHWMGDYATYNGDHCKWASLQHLSVGYQLLDFKASTAHEEAFRLACIYFVSLTRSTFDLKCAAKSVHALRDALKGTFSLKRDHWDQRNTWLLWISVVGGIVAQETSDAAWFVSIAAGAARRVGVRSLAALEEKLAKVLYDQAIIGVATSSFWNSYLSPLLGDEEP